MIFLLKDDVTQQEAQSFVYKLKWMSIATILTQENGQYYVTVTGGIDTNINLDQFSIFPCVKSIIASHQKYKLAGREAKLSRSVIRINNHTIGGENLAIMAGPCSIESEEQIHNIAQLVAAVGANFLRGGAFKPRTSPYDFQGLGKIGLQYMQSAARKNNLLSVSEVMDTRDVDLVANYIDILQIGARNMQNFDLLKEVGRSGKPVLLKRGLSATYLDFLLSAEYILSTGNPNVILCERGIRTFETYARNTLDIAAVPILHELSHLPVIIDPSHGTGIRKIVPAMVYAAIAAGADGIMVEVHFDPDNSISDAKQTISVETFAEMMDLGKKINNLVHHKAIQESVISSI